MPKPIDIDYARANADVVRKKFRRRVVMLVIATVVVIVVGIARLWRPAKRETWLIGSQRVHNSFSMSSTDNWINMYGPSNGIVEDEVPAPVVIGNNTVGFALQRSYSEIVPSWYISIRYRTLFILAMIPWIITLIRMIRVWRVKHAVQIDR